MTYAIIKYPHPLDDLWSFAMEAVEKAEAAVDDLKKPYTDAEIDKLVEVRNRAVDAALALPARNLSDTLYKLNVSGICDHVTVSADGSAILNEALSVLEDGMERGRDLQREAANAAS
ncbi:MAG: hypothetical protein DI537_42545 [Stutzerimonas stutzeri]|nr:MAG: hypothetical protein DI537_42545 [Stutzerimonas stutzeri]